VPGVFSSDEDYRRQNLIENTIWQCFELEGFKVS
jgi:hypothetical protein